jgi:hypothetical protein
LGRQAHGAEEDGVEALENLQEIVRNDLASLLMVSAAPGELGELECKAAEALLDSTARSTRIASATTSGPMPSPA